jgi:hypothetical protein
MSTDQSRRVDPSSVRHGPSALAIAAMLAPPAA